MEHAGSAYSSTMWYTMCINVCRNAAAFMQSYICATCIQEYVLQGNTMLRMPHGAQQ
jgi:hypothetical protein